MARFAIVVGLLALSPATPAQVHDFKGYWRDQEPPGAYCGPALAGDGNALPAEDVCRATFAWDRAAGPVKPLAVRLLVDRYVSSAEEECILLWDVDENDPDYLAAQISVAVFEDLGQGIPLSGPRCIAAADVDRWVLVNLAPDAWIEAAQQGWLGVGIVLTTQDGSTALGDDGDPAEYVRFAQAELVPAFPVFWDGFEGGDTSAWDGFEVLASADHLQEPISFRASATVTECHPSGVRSSSTGSESK